MPARARSTSTYRDADGNYLGAQSYKLRVLPNIPAKNVWSSTMRSDDRSCRNDSRFPTVSSYIRQQLQQADDQRGGIDRQLLRLGRGEGEARGRRRQTWPGRGPAPTARGTKPLSDASARNLCRASGCSARCTCGPVGAGTSDEAPSS